MGKKSAGTKSGKASVAAVVDTDDETTTDVEDYAAGGEDTLVKVLNPDSVRPNIQSFVDWVVEQGGPKINPKHAQVVVTGYKRFQKSDAAKSAREEAVAAKAEARAEREAAREQRAKDRAAKAEERAERAEAREKAKAEKAAKAKKSPAEASAPKGKKGKAAKPTPTASAGKSAGAPTAKKTAAKKKAKKAAF
jgi:hypothetical protein